MSVTEEYFRLIMEVKGQQALVDQEKQLQALRDKAEELKRQYQAQTITEDQLERETLQLARAFSALEQSGGKVNKSMVNAGYATMEFGRIFQDVAQGGIGGGLNNIERATMFLGGGPGLAGIITGLGVALFLLKPQIEEGLKNIGLFGDSADVAKGKVEQFKDRIKELEEKPHKLAIDIVELENARKTVDAITAGIKAFEEFKARQADDTKAAGAGVSDILGAAPGGAEALAGQLSAAMARQLTAQSKTLQETARELEFYRAELKKAEEGPLREGEDATTRAGQIRVIQNEIARRENEAAAARLKIEDEAKEKVGNAIKAAEAGNAAGREALARQLEGAGQVGLGEAVRGMTPEEARERRRAATQAEQDRKENRAKAKEQEAKDRLGKDLTEQGKRHEEIGRKEEEQGQKQRIDDARKAQEERERRAVQAKRDEDAENRELARGVKETLESARERQRNAAETIFQQTGGVFGKEGSMQAGNRALDLQNKGIGIMESYQQSVAEQMAIMNGQWARLEALQQNAAEIVAQTRRMRNAMGRASVAPSALNVNGGGEN